MRDGEFDLPDALEVNHNAVGIVRLQFHFDDADTIKVHLDQTRLLSLVSQVHEKIDKSTLTPISRSLVREGEPIQVEGVKFVRLPEGGLSLRIFAVVDGRHVWIPFQLPPEGVTDLRNAIAAID